MGKGDTPALSWIYLSEAVVPDLGSVVWFRGQDGPVPPGPAEKALARALTGLTLSGTQEVTAELARGAAALCDSAERAQDPRLWLAASQRLTALTSTLFGPTAASGPSSSGTGSSSGPSRDGGSRAGDDGDDLADLMGAGPEVGHPTHT